MTNLKLPAKAPRSLNRPRAQMRESRPTATQVKRRNPDLTAKLDPKLRVKLRPRREKKELLPNGLDTSSDGKEEKRDVRVDMVTKTARV